MNEMPPRSRLDLSDAQQKQIDQICRDFHAIWRRGGTPRIEDFLDRCGEIPKRVLLLELLTIELKSRTMSDEGVGTRQYQLRFPEYIDVVDEAMDMVKTRQHSPTVHEQHIDTDEQDKLERLRQLTGKGHQKPEKIGRYLVKDTLGGGAFASVYMAFDSKLERSVALKVPHYHSFQNPDQLNSFLDEARAAAKLSHPGLVTVYDVVEFEDRYAIVQEYIEGATLAQTIFDEFHVGRTIAMLIEMVEALAYLHEQGFVHRDLKPANILIDRKGHIHVADFGLTLHDDARRKRVGERAGSPIYMSPEQTRGESHRLDGRSDLWSVGVIMYELLTRRLPFSGDSVADLYVEIQEQEPRPPRQWEPRIPQELQRICLKCLEKPSCDRYSSAALLLDDLRNWNSPTVGQRDRTAHKMADGSNEQADTQAGVTQVIPKGLRSFDDQDADFFLQLLPGPRDRSGLPDTIRFWKSRIEETDAEKTFAVGLIFGPSGCGKSSLVKAGLIPNLSTGVLSQYVEATSEETETRLLRALYKLHSRLPEQLSLSDALAWLRNDQNSPKTVLFVDQFEQWLHAHSDEPNVSLIHALRQCDGSKVQCILMVRDDFWMAVCRFVRELEVRLIEGENFAALDLFDLEHAKKVLALFGSAFGRIDGQAVDLSEEQRAFIDQAVSGLATNGKVICIRLALFAEMMKGRSWTTASLKEVGGTQGIGVTFLEESFGSSKTSPEHRIHQKAARRVLAALLPNDGTDIKGRMRSYKALLEESGYSERPREFANLIDILDRELRLITPTDPEASDDASVGPAEQRMARQAVPDKSRDERYFQLTHDDLVPPLRIWLRRKQKESRQGRAQLRLEERSNLWIRKRDKRLLPTGTEWLSIRLYASRQYWTEQQRALMRHADRAMAVRAGSILAIVAVAFIATLYAQRYWAQRQAIDWVNDLQQASTSKLNEILDEGVDHQPWAERELRKQYARSDKKDDERLNLALGLVAYDSPPVDYLCDRLLDIRDQELPLLHSVLDELISHKDLLAQFLWPVLNNDQESDHRRFRAALALAFLVGESENWMPEHFEFLAAQLVGSSPVYQPELQELLAEIRLPLIEPLQLIFHDGSQTKRHRVAAAGALSKYCAGDDLQIEELLLASSAEQFEQLLGAWNVSYDPESTARLIDFVKSTPQETNDVRENVQTHTARAIAAIALLRSGQREAVFDVLRYNSNPESMTQFVFRCRDYGVAPEEIIECYEIVNRSRGEFGAERKKVDDSVLYALTLALGEYAATEFDDRLNELVSRLEEVYQLDPSSGVHSATGWLLRKLGYEKSVRAVDETELPYDPSGHREWFVIRVPVPEFTVPEHPEPIDELYFTMIVFEPGDFQVGSPEFEYGREYDETLASANIPNRFAVCDRELTWLNTIAYEGNEIREEFVDDEHLNLALDAPSYSLFWSETVDYCEWLNRKRWGEQGNSPYKIMTVTGADGLRYPSSWKLYPERPGFRQPTEREWEFVCRSGTTTAFSFGNDPSWLEKFGWIFTNSDESMQPGARLRPNPRGLFDVHGNLFEWCFDWYSEHRIDSITGPNGGIDRIDRGGSFLSGQRLCRSAYRDKTDPSGIYSEVGFRLAYSIPEDVVPADETGDETSDVSEDAE